MYAGQLVEEAATTELFHAAAHPYTKALLASNPQLSVAGERLLAIPGSVPAPGSWPTGCRFAPRCAEAIAECRQGPVALRAAAPGHLARCVHVRQAEIVEAVGQ
jgi:peptide/nickel transport system permease protein